VANRCWLFIGFAWVRSSYAGFRIDLATRTARDDLVRGAAPQLWMAVWCAAGGGQVLVACPMYWAVGGRGGCGVKGGRQAVATAIASATLEAGGTAAEAVRRATPPAG
jgi:hypothetical protein